MSDGTAIEWTHRPGTIGVTWNPIRARNIARGRAGWFCVHASEGCRHCYAEQMNAWRGNGVAYAAPSRDKVRIFVDGAALRAPLHWRKTRTAFVCSMTDLFGDFHDDATIDRVFAVMALAPAHTFIVLTKRAARMRDYLTTDRRWELCGAVDALLPWRTGASRAARDRLYRRAARGIMALENVWLGVSVEDQGTADRRIPDLLATPAALRFVSYEPALGPVDLTRLCLVPQKPGSPRAGIHVDALRGRYCESGLAYKGDWDINGPVPPDGGRRFLDWVIAGGESGPEARPAHPDWFRKVRDDCAAAGVPFFFKQWGAWLPHDPRAGGDLGGDVRAGRVRMVHPTGQTDVEVFEATGGRSTVPGSRYMARVGKKAAGALLDGVAHRDFPQQGAGS